METAIAIGYARQFRDWMDKKFIFLLPKSGWLVWGHRPLWTAGILGLLFHVVCMSIKIVTMVKGLVRRASIGIE